MDQNPRRRYRKDDDDLFDDNPDEDSYYYNDQYENDPDLEENEVIPLPVESISPPLTTDNEALAQIVIIPKVVAYKPGVDDKELDEILHEVEDDEDKHQHYFSDQVHFNRPKWERWWFGTVAMIAFSVDMSNLVAFPNNVASLGGAAYLIVYFIVLICFGYPFLYLECIVGQYFQTGMIGIWGISPIFRGLGAGIFYITFVIIAYIPSNILWASILMSDSFVSIKTGKLPWSTCENDWNSCRCFGNRIPECMDWKDDENLTTKAPGVDIVYTPALEYFIGRMLQMWKSKYSDPILIKDITLSGNWTTAYGPNNKDEGLGPLIASSCFIVGGIYLIILFLNWIEMKNLGYWYTFTTAFPLLVMSLLFCRGITLEGALSGLAKYFKPSFDKIFEFQIWYVAFLNAFYSVGSGLGCHIMMSSFNPLNHNVRRDALICIIADTSMSLLGSLVAFMFVGHVYVLKREPLPDHFPGDNFVFISLAEAFTTISGSSFFSFIFYFMIIVFCADTQMVTLHALSFSLYEEYKRKYPDQVVSKGIFLYTVWGFAFTVTLLSTTRGGYWIFIFLTEHGFGLSAFVFMFLEIVLFAWIWGIDEVCSACVTIMGHRPSLYMRITWKYLLPVLFLSIVIYSNGIRKFVPIRVFDQVAINASKGLGLIFQWIAIALMAIYATYIYARMLKRSKGLSCLQMLMIVISPEYEHDSIREDVKTAKRLTWAHYTFLLYDDEKGDAKMKEIFKEWQQKVNAFAGKIKGIFGGKNDEKSVEPLESDVGRDGGGGKRGHGKHERGKGGGGKGGDDKGGGGKGGDDKGGGGGKDGGVGGSTVPNTAILDNDVPNQGKKKKKNAKARAEMRMEEENAWEMWEKLKYRADVDFEDEPEEEPVQSLPSPGNSRRQINQRRTPARGGQRQIATSSARRGRGGGMATKSILRNNKVNPQ